MDNIQPSVSRTKAEPHTAIEMDDQRITHPDFLAGETNFGAKNAPNLLLDSTAYKETDKIKCAEIFRYTKSKQWEYACYLCTKSIETIIEFVSHLEEHFTSDDEAPSIQPKIVDIIHSLPTEAIVTERGIASPRCVGPGPANANEDSEDSNRTAKIQLSDDEWPSDKSTSEPKSKRKYSVKARFLPEPYESNFSSYTCDICLKQLPDKHAIYKHLLGEHKRTKCKYCDKRFNSQSQLSKHQTRHENKTEYQCEICARRFRDERGLTFHMRKHSGEKNPYICDICEKTFTRSSTMRVSGIVT